MILVKPNSVEWKSFLALMPVIGIGICCVFFGFGWFSSINHWLFGFTYIMAVGLVIWYGDVVLTRLIHDKYAAFKDTLKRIAVLIFKQVIMICISTSLMFVGFNFFKVLPFHPTTAKFLVAFLIALGVTLIAMIIWEGDYVISQWKESVIEKEKYAQLSLQSEFDTLKRQVNPHFLFNCFNTLSSLITEDKERAEAFLNELSKVYRYLLKNNIDDMSTLRSEAEFIQSYFELLKTRHSDAVALQLEIDTKYEKYLLPSLSLQMLVENAVKHNALSKAQPLTIDIFTTVGNKLVVNNNIQPRAHKAVSGNVGLKNIRSKYELLKQPGFQLMEDAKNFTVVLPLIWNRVEDIKNEII